MPLAYQQAAVLIVQSPGQTGYGRANGVGPVVSTPIVMDQIRGCGKANGGGGIRPGVLGHPSSPQGHVIPVNQRSC